jgi:hypothetical protein
MANDTPDDAARAEAEKKKDTLEPIDYQCVLLENVHRIKRDYPTFKNVTILKDPEGNEGTLMSRIQHGGRSDEIKEILNLCPEVYASLLPYLRLSRVDYDKNDPTKIVQEIPLEIPNFLSPNDVDQITKGQIGRAPGAGIKSFSWSLDGVQPAEVDNNITATLVVYFQSLSDFFKGAETSPNKYAAQRPNKATFLDLIINAPTSRTVGTSNSTKPPNVCKPTGTNLEYDGGGFRIKVCAGWTCPDNLSTMFPHFTNEKAELIKKAIDATRVSLYLQQVRHNLQFNQNGSLTLTVTYQAAISGMATSEKFNVLKPTEKSLSASENAKLTKLQEELKDLRKGAEGESDAALESRNEKIDRKLEEINDLQQKDKKLKYQALLDGLYRSNKIRAFRVSNSELLIPDLKYLTEEERREYFKNRASASTDKAKINSVTGVGSAVLEALKNPDNESTDDAREEAEKKVDPEKAPEIDRTQQTDIHFMYLGDIIDNVLSQIQENNDIPDFDYQIFMQKIKFIDLSKAFQLSDNDLTVLSKCSNATAVAQIDQTNLNNIYDLLPISEIPISMDLFQTWFIDRVIKPERNKYYLLHFLKDLTSTLVTNALRAGCYGTKFRIYQRFDIQPINYSLKRPAIPMSVKDLGAAQARLTCDESPDNTRNGMVMYSTDSKGVGLTGDFDKDLEQGIYHQYIGASCGLLKELNFSREEQSYLREAKIQKDGALGAEQLRELFSVDIKMVGNNLFKNGQLTYVNPVLINTTKEQLRLLGLHGYYLITAVKSEVTEGGFTTTLKALQEGIEFPAVPPGVQDDTTETPEPSNSVNPAEDQFVPLVGSVPGTPE